MQIFIVLGAPRSGLTLLSDCLSLLGMASPANSKDAGVTSPGQINRLLLQDLQRDPTMVGGLPSDWLETAAATKARTRIEALLEEGLETTAPYLIADSALCRVLPLWLAVFRDLKVEPRFIHLLRHPWETARSLAQTDGVDLLQAHLLWLASHRDALANSKNHARAILTFDQLLANPVSALTGLGNALAIDYPISLESAYPRLLSLVQPALKHHHAGQASEEDRDRFAPFNRMYDALRVMQTDPGVGINRDRSVHVSTDASTDTAWARLGLPSPADESESSTGTELVDLLFKVLGAQEQQVQVRGLQNARPADGSQARQPLVAEFYFPQTEGAYLTEQIPLPADEWQRITLPVPRPDLLYDHPLRFSPLNCHGTVLISALKLVNRATGEVLWAAQTPQDFDALTLEGTVLRLPDLDNLVLLVTGNDASVRLSGVEKLPDCPVGFEVWMKVSRNQSLISVHWDKKVRELDNIKHQLTEQNEKIEALTQSMDGAQNQIRNLFAIINNSNSSNIFQSFNRRLENDHVRIIKSKWLPLLNLELRDSHLRYLAHKICQVENRCSGRLATTVQDALLRVIVAMSVKKRTVSIIEIGSLFGVALASYYECLRGLFDKINLTAIDPLNGYYDKDEFDILTRTPVNKSIFESNLLFNNVPRDDVLLIQDLSTSEEAFHIAESKRYDMLNIDGDHTFEGVKYDFDQYHQLITPGGFVFFDDYNAKEWPGVKKFVDQEVLHHPSFKLIGSEWRSIVFQKTS